MYNDILFNIVDEIDHFTLAYRQKGIFDCKKAYAMIRKYGTRYPEAEALNLKHRTNDELEKEPISELYDELIKLRTFLLDKSELL